MKNSKMLENFLTQPCGSPRCRRMTLATNLALLQWGAGTYRLPFVFKTNPTAGIRLPMLTHQPDRWRLMRQQACTTRLRRLIIQSQTTPRPRSTCPPASPPPANRSAPTAAPPHHHSPPASPSPAPPALPEGPPAAPPPAPRAFLPPVYAPRHSTSASGPGWRSPRAPAHALPGALRVYR